MHPVEATMATDQDPKLSDVDYRALAPAQKAAVRQHALRLAHAVRARLITSLLRAWLAGLAGLTARLWQTARLRHRRRSAVSELNGLPDRMLRDMGINRSEIWSFTHGCNDNTRRPRGEPREPARDTSPTPRRAA